MNNLGFESDEPLVMGVLNLTPDSFSDGGQFLDPGAALTHAGAMAREGAQIIDVGGESTRPGAQPVPVQTELERVIPAIESITESLDVMVSIDTRKPEVMREAVSAGAGMINDVNALRAAGALGVAADTGVAVCLMHMQGEPQTMQEAPYYDDVVAQVSAFLCQRAEEAQRAGVKGDRIVVDPGFGFGKTVAHNLQLLAALEQLTDMGYPLLVGMSRKSMLRSLLDVPPRDRVFGGVAAAALAVGRGARIIRTHDVRPTVHAVKVATAAKSKASSF